MPLAVAAGRRASTVGLGSDVSGGAELSLFGVMRTGAYAQQARRTLAADGRRAARSALSTGFGSRRSTGRGRSGSRDAIGSIEAGKEADLIAVGTRPLHDGSSRG